MSDTITAHDRMTDAYMLLSDQLPLDAAARELQSSSKPYGVLIDRAGTAQGLVTAESLERALKHVNEEHSQRALAETRRWLPPLLTTRAETPLAVIVAQSRISLLRYGVEGKVVIDEQGVVGVLSREAIANYLAFEYQPTGRLAGSTLPGVIITPPVLMICAVCSYPNDIDDIDPDVLPPCQNPAPPMGQHQLGLGWL